METFYCSAGIRRDNPMRDSARMMSVSCGNILLNVSLCVFQVDSSETLSDSDPEGKALREVHSIGVQVEDDKR